ncbi:MAG: hypothetical protein QM820_04100 [Minicystis sp.]
MVAPILPQGTSLLDIKTQNDFTRSRLAASPLTAALAVAFADFEAQRWMPVLLQELALGYEVARAAAAATHADDALDGLVKKLNNAVLLLTGGNREAPLFQRYFGRALPHEIAEPELGPQLRTMADWTDALAASPHASLQAIGVEIQAAVAAGSAAAKALADAEEALADFRSLGARAQMIDACNALRQATWGKLGELAHVTPQLAAGFPDRFFLHGGRRRNDRMTIAEIEAKLGSLRAQTVAWEKRLVSARAKADAQAETKAQRAKRLAELAEKKKQAAALAAEVRRLRAEIGK